jgi:hypothetical protein
VRKYVGKPARISPLTIDKDAYSGKKDKFSSRDKLDSSRRDSIPALPPKKEVRKEIKKVAVKKQEVADDFEEERHEYPVQRHRPARLQKPVEQEEVPPNPIVAERKKSVNAGTFGPEDEYPAVAEKIIKRNPEPVYQPDESEEEEEVLANPTSQYTIQDGDPEEFVVHAQLFPCSICSRSFADESRLEKHSLACKKSTKPRKVFDAKKNRVQGTELEKYASPKKVCYLLD